jgi:sugar lactone lactonase YvrE
MIKFASLSQTVTNTRFLSGSLIISSDAKEIFKVDKNGNEIANSIPVSAFSSVNRSPDGLAIDPSDNSLWVSTESNSSGTAADIRAWNIDFDTGLPISSFGINEFDPSASQIEGICVDPWDFTIWLVADGPGTINLYHLQRNGSLIQTYNLLSFGITSPQDLCIDPVLQRIIITDNHQNSLYFFDLGINLVNSVLMDKLDPVPTSLRGISYDPSNGFYWITYYQPEDWIVLIDREGRPLHKFPNTNYTNNSYANPTGIAVRL